MTNDTMTNDDLKEGPVMPDFFIHRYNKTYYKQL